MRYHPDIVCRRALLCEVGSRIKEYKNCKILLNINYFFFLNL